MKHFMNLCVILAQGSCSPRAMQSSLYCYLCTTKASMVNIILNETPTVFVKPAYLNRICTKFSYFL